MEQRLSGHDVSFDPDPEDDEDYAPAAYLPGPPNSDPARLVEQSDWDADAHDRLDGALEKLDARSRDILARRWLTDDKATLHELAAGTTCRRAYPPNRGERDREASQANGRVGFLRSSRTIGAQRKGRVAVATRPLLLPDREPSAQGERDERELTRRFN
jgi:hypothetical protein